jgi:hypothetical protein
MNLDERSLCVVSSRDGDLAISAFGLDNQPLGSNLRVTAAS